MLSAMRYEYEHHSLFASMSRHNPKLHALSHRLLLFSHPDPPFGNMSHTSCGDFFLPQLKNFASMYRVCIFMMFYDLCLYQMDFLLFFLVF